VVPGGNISYLSIKVDAAIILEVQIVLLICEFGKCDFILKHLVIETSGSQTFSGHRPVGYPVPPALSYIKHSTDQRLAQPTKEDNYNKIKMLHLVTTFFSLAL
jgi:hypothetical protein